MACIFKYALSGWHWLLAAVAPFFYTGWFVVSVANAELADLQPTLTSDQTALVQQPQVNDSPSSRSSTQQSSTLEGVQPDDESAAMLYSPQLLIDEFIRLKSLVAEQRAALKKIMADQSRQQLDLVARLTKLGYVAPTDFANDLKAKKAQEEQVAYKVALALASQQRFDESAKRFQSFLADYPDGRFVADALFWMGEIYLILSEPQIEKSRQAYMQLLRHFPEHQYVATALYKLGHIHHQLGQTEKSKEFFERVSKEYPASTAARLATNYGS